jgi:hypothetical protein
MRTLTPVDEMIGLADKNFPFNKKWLFRIIANFGYNYEKNSKKEINNG